MTEAVALVTGGARGLGLGTAVALAEQGFAVALLDRDPAGAGSLARLPGGAGLHAFVEADLTISAQVDSAIETVSAKLGNPSVLVNNAGALRPTRFAEITESEWDMVIDSSLKSAFLCCKACVPLMRDAGHGRIVNMSSTAGKNVSTLGGAHYTTAKAAMLGLTRALALETAADGITVNAVCPGLFSTEMTRAALAPDELDAIGRSFPIGRLGTPEEVGALVAFLCSAAAAYITGAAIDINGGDLMV